MGAAALKRARRLFPLAIGEQCKHYYSHAQFILVVVFWIFERVKVELKSTRRMRDRGRRGKKNRMEFGAVIVEWRSWESASEAQHNCVATFICVFLRPGGISIALFAYGTSPDDLFHVSFQILGGGDHIKRDPYGENKKTGKLEAHEHNGQLVCPSVKYTLLLFLILIWLVAVVVVATGHRQGDVV
jgi:hypothetical protein